MGEMKKISLSQGTEVDIRGLKVNVYAPTFDIFVDLQSKIANYEKIKDFKVQVSSAVDILYDLLRPYNEQLTKEVIKSKFTMEAFLKIVQLALGNTAS